MQTRMWLPLAVLAACLANSASGDEKLQEALADEVAEHWLYDDWKAAVAQAEQAKKPIFAVFRCVP